MSAAYEAYLVSHKNSVAEAYKWIRDRIPWIIEGTTNKLNDAIYNHDASKSEPDEYKAYDDYFYGERTSEVEEAFNLAWLTHIHRNPHHWQYWVLYEDEGKVEPLKMPSEYVFEMICDWWSFSFRKGDLYELFAWYDEHKNKMILHEETRKLVEYILSTIKSVLDAEKGKTNNG